MKHLTMTYISLLMFAGAMTTVSGSDLSELRSSISHVFRQIESRSIDARAILYNERASGQLLPRFEDDFAFVLA